MKNPLLEIIDAAAPAIVESAARRERKRIGRNLFLTRLLLWVVTVAGIAAMLVLLAYAWLTRYMGFPFPWYNAGWGVFVVLLSVWQAGRFDLQLRRLEWEYLRRYA